MTPVYAVMCFRLRRARELYRAGMIPVAEFRQRLEDLGYHGVAIDVEVMENEAGAPVIVHCVRRMVDAE